MSNTFINLPFSGNTPYLFRSSFDNPETIPALAESPSHKINTQSLERVVPAQFASINFGIPRILLVFLPSVFFAALFSFNSVRLIAASITPSLIRDLMKSSGTSHLDPNLATGVLSVSFVCESKAGFSTTQLTNNMSCSLIVLAFTLIFFFFSIKAIVFLII